MASLCICPSGLRESRWLCRRLPWHNFCNRCFWEVGISQEALVPPRCCEEEKEVGVFLYPSLPCGEDWLSGAAVCARSPLERIAGDSCAHVPAEAPLRLPGMCRVRSRRRAWSRTRGFRCLQSSSPCQPVNSSSDCSSGLLPSGNPSYGQAPSHFLLPFRVCISRARACPSFIYILVS